MDDLMPKYTRRSKGSHLFMRRIRICFIELIISF